MHVNLIFLCLFGALLSSVAGYTFIVKKCPDGIKPGDYWNTDNCEECVCRTDQTGSCVGCGMMGVPEGCKWKVTNSSLLYPGCCEGQAVCG